MKLNCDGFNVRLRLDHSEKNSMLITGNSRSGKTFFASNLAAGLMGQGYRVHLIDLGEKWSFKDKERLRLAGARTTQVEQEGLELIFQNNQELTDCARQITNALGIQSAGAIAALKNTISQFAGGQNANVRLQDIINALNSDNKEISDEKEWSKKIYARLDSCGDVPDIRFKVEHNGIFSNTSTIWELSGLDEVYTQLVTYLILYCIHCQQRYYFKIGAFASNISLQKRVEDKSTFVIVDEFQNLDCNRRAIIGTCLTEGQKYKLSLILITQFLAGNFSEAVINQFKQGGYRFYFRLTEEEAWNVSGQLVCETSKRRVLVQKLTHLPVGKCLMLGAHSLENQMDVSENFRFVQVEEELCSKATCEHETTAHKYYHMIRVSAR